MIHQLMSLQLARKEIMFYCREQELQTMNRRYEKEYSISFEKTNINDLDKPVESNYVKHDKGFKLFGIQFTKPYDYVYGWFAYEQKHFKTIIMNKFVLEII